MNVATATAISEFGAVDAKSMPRRAISKFDAVDVKTRRVMQSPVNSGIRGNYETQNIKFIVWMFDHREHYSTLLLKAGLVAELET